jgi:hypothetical protein
MGRGLGISRMPTRGIVALGSPAGSVVKTTYPCTGLASQSTTRGSTVLSLVQDCPRPTRFFDSKAACVDRWEQPASCQLLGWPDHPASAHAADRWRQGSLPSCPAANGSSAPRSLRMRNASRVAVVNSQPRLARVFRPWRCSTARPHWSTSGSHPTLAGRARQRSGPGQSLGGPARRRPPAAPPARWSG